MSITDQINAQVKTLVDEVKNLTETLRKVELDDLRSQATGLVGSARAEVQEGYAELVQKGEEFVAQARALKLEDVQKRGEKLLDALRTVLYTEPGWDKPITQERLHDLLDRTRQDLEEPSC